MTRYIELNGVKFKQVKLIPCSTHLTGRKLSDVYGRYSNRKASSFNAWQRWVNEINNHRYTGNWLCITAFYISAYTAQFYTLVFRGFCRLPEKGAPVEFIACATGRNNYIKLI